MSVEEDPPRPAGTVRVTTAALMVGLALMAGWALRGAIHVEPADPRPAVQLPDTGAAPPTARADTVHVSPDEAGAAQPGIPPEPIETSSGLVIPVAGVRPEDLIDTYTSARGEGRTHDAIDILAPRGTAVLAASAGRVARLFNSDRGGRTIYILTGADGRTVHYYAHLQSYARGLSAGDTVRAGQVIGSVGDSGNAAPGNTHLHFAIWRVADPRSFWDGAPVNPYPLLRGRSR
jgi:murein DD-endopeptidase MepM/ murein hydrolase activator NlpD